MEPERPSIAPHWSEIAHEASSLEAYKTPFQLLLATELRVPLKKGTPTLYDPMFCEWLLEDMGRGYSLTAFGASIGVTRSNLHSWSVIHSEFGDALARAKQLQLRFYESKHIHVAETGGVGSQGQAAWRGMVNAGKDEWSDKQQIEHSGSIALGDLVAQSLIDITPRETGES